MQNKLRFKLVLGELRSLNEARRAVVKVKPRDDEALEICVPLRLVGDAVYLAQRRVLGLLRGGEGE